MEEDNNEVVLMKKYKLMEKIGSGSFGSIYKCIFNLKHRLQSLK